MKQQANKTINNDIIQKQFQTYLDECSIQSRTELLDNNSSSPKEKIFLACTRDFVNFKITFDMFSAVLGMLWITNKDTFNVTNQTNIEEYCYKAMELQWYLRNNPEQHIQWLSEILEYYQTNKSK